MTETEGRQLTEHVEPEVAECLSTQILAVRDFCRRYRVTSEEEKHLVTLFGQFATAGELLRNVSRTPRWRGWTMSKAASINALCGRAKNLTASYDCAW